MEKKKEKSKKSKEINADFLEINGEEKLETFEENDGINRIEDSPTISADKIKIDFLDRYGRFPSTHELVRIVEKEKSKIKNLYE